MKFLFIFLLSAILAWQFSFPPVISAPVLITEAQQLPITAQLVIDEQIIDLEVARTVKEQSIGLMYRSSLAPNRGMLFIFNPPRSTRFWMKNVEIPLDIIFLQQGKIIGIFANVPPCEEEPCPTYGPPSDLVDQVIELRSGRAAELNLSVGDSLTIRFQ